MPVRAVLPEAAVGARWGIGEYSISPGSLVCWLPWEMGWIQEALQSQCLRMRSRAYQLIRCDEMIPDGPDTVDVFLDRVRI